jgi:predicted DNA-binding transcriptional regulator YafY
MTSFARGATETTIAMRRADRLFEIIQRLRRGRGRVVTARALAEPLAVSERTIYRDIQELVASGVPIEGAAGVGYSLRKGYDLPPLMFSEGELEAIVFGARIVQSWSDPEMARAADAALGKIDAVLPERLRHLITDASLQAPATNNRAPLCFDLARLRAAVRTRKKIRFAYRDEKGAETVRTVWPLALWFYGPVWLTGAWCELRDDFRFFRLERMADVDFLAVTFPRERGRTAEDLVRLMVRPS